MGGEWGARDRERNVRGERGKKNRLERNKKRAAVPSALRRDTQKRTEKNISRRTGETRIGDTFKRMNARCTRKEKGKTF